MGLANLSHFVLQQIGAIPVQDADRPCRDRRRVHRTVETQARRLDSDHAHVGILDEGIEEPDRVGAAVDAGDHDIGQAPSCSSIWRRASLPITDLKIAHDHRIRMRPGGGADQIVGISYSCDPVAQGLVERVLEALAAAIDAVTFAPSSFMRKTLSDCRSTSTLPMKTSHCRLNSAAIVAVATPCWPAPVSAVMRSLPIRSASSA